MRVKLGKLNGLSALTVLAVQRVGIKRSALLVDAIKGWEMTVRKYGRPVTAEEFADYWAISPATAYRRLDLFREAFPEVRYPHDLMGPLLDAIAAKQALPAELSWLEVVA